jgi:hypothetical protein
MVGRGTENREEGKRGNDRATTDLQNLGEDDGIT